MKERLLWGAGMAAAALLVTANAQAAPARKSPARKPVKKVSRPAAKPTRSTTGATQKKPADPVTALFKDLTSLDVAPASAALEGPRSSQRLIVLGTTRDGATVDVTDHVTFGLSDKSVAKIAGGVLYPVKDGETRVTATLGKLKSGGADFTVANADAESPLDFINDVMPILAKGGCNNTACHGSPVGKGGFKLSLFGYEPDLDHPAIVKSDDGRRVNLKEPEKSLLLTKATMAVPHGGGMRFKVGSPEYKTLLQWLKDGASGLAEFEARVKQVVVIPDEPWMPRPGVKQRLAVTAVMSDGTTRDVTDKVLFSSNDDAIAEVDEYGNVTARRQGETAVMVRYLGQVAISRVAVLPALKPEKYPKLAQNNYIDEFVQKKLQKLHMVPSDLCTDEEFVRRVYLDVCGIIPTPEEVRSFVSDSSPNKRAKLIDVLLEREEHVDLWAMKWNDTLRNNPRLTRLGVGAFAKWIREQVAANRPFDEFTRDLITAKGKNTNLVLDLNNLPPQLQRNPRGEQLARLVNSVAPNPASNYYVISRDPLDVTSATSQIFMGVRIECARCHNHPFEKWTQNDYYGLAAFFTGIRAQGGNQAPNVVQYNPRAPGPRHPKTNEVMDPKTLDDVELRKFDRGDDRRVAFAEWMTSPSNAWFSPALVNRLWGHYFGRGIVEPIDDFRVTNPASNPELLAALAKDFTDHKFDVKHMHRVILNSRAYQQSSKPNQYNQADTANFARFYPKRLMAEQLYDSISQATGVFLETGPIGRNRRRRPQVANLQVQAALDAMPEGQVTRVMQLAGIVPGQNRGGLLPAAQFLNTFGKPRREAVCECERSSDGNIGQALALINGDIVNQKIAAPQSRVQSLAASGKPDPLVIEELYLAALSRRPNPTEMEEAAALLRSSASRKEGIEDLMWSLLNSREFLFNH